jgi:hypothetical protein
MEIKMKCLLFEFMDPATQAIGEIFIPFCGRDNKSNLSFVPNRNAA